MKHVANGLTRIQAIKIGALPQTPEFIALFSKLNTGLYENKESRSCTDAAPTFSFESPRSAQVALQRCPILTTKQSDASMDTFSGFYSVFTVVHFHLCTRRGAVPAELFL